MPYDPQERFDPSLIFRGITGAGEALGGGLADMMKKRQEAEAQAAGSHIQFTTLKNAGLLSPEEEAMFHSGNANKKAAIVTSATPRLLQKFRTEQEQRQEQQHQIQRDLQLKIAQMHYANNGSPLQAPVTDPRTGMVWDGGRWRKPAGSADAWSKNMAVARGTLEGENFVGKDDGEMVKLVTPQGKEMIIPWKAYEGRTQQQQPAIPVAEPVEPPPYQPSAGVEQVIPQTNYAAPVAPSANAIIAKNGHHYEVDHASKKVIRQID